MSIPSHKEFCLAKYSDQTIPFLINRKLLIHKQLERPPRTYAVYSDLHGSYEKYLYWLKNGLGYFRIAISEIMGESYTPEIYQHYEKLLLLVNRTRINTIANHINQETSDTYTPIDFLNEPVSAKFQETLRSLESYGISRKRIIEDMLKFLRLITRWDEHRIIKVIPSQYLENVLKLYLKDGGDSYHSLLNGIIKHEKVYYIVASIITKLTLMNVYDKHICLGDTFDRGNDADKIMTLYRIYFGPETNASPLHYIWGNHDILWMGASIGNPILCITALRISMRYNNIDFLFRYGFNLDKLKKLATDSYKELPTGSYVKAKDFSKWPKDIAIKMTKTLTVLEAKLSVSYLRDALSVPGDIDYQQLYKHHVSLLNLFPTGIKEDPKEWDAFIKKNPLYTDVYFPTIDPHCPEQLTSDEREVVDDLVKQFTSLYELQRDIKWMFNKGETYRVVDNTLYYHAALPATDDMELAEIKGLKGKRLLDFIQRDLKRIGEHHRTGEAVTIREKMLLWYLWCGPESPFFCKSKMATIERAIFNKDQASGNELTSWKEISNPYYKHIRNDIFLNKILVEFHADKICMGHTPVKTAQQGILGEHSSAFIVDGGASDAYGDRGAVLINTPDYTYLTLHPSLEELQNAEKEDRLPNLEIIPLEERKNLKLRHVDKGYFLKRELEAIDELINAKIDHFCDKYFRE